MTSAAIAVTAFALGMGEDAEQPIETFVQAFPPVNIDVFDAAFTQVFVLVVCLGVLACCLCRSVTVIVTT